MCSPADRNACQSVSQTARKAEIAAAANRLGLTPTGFCARAALDAARNLNTSPTEPMEHEALGNLQAPLSTTTYRPTRRGGQTKPSAA